MLQFDEDTQPMLQAGEPAALAHRKVRVKVLAVFGFLVALLLFTAHHHKGVVAVPSLARAIVGLEGLDATTVELTGVTGLIQPFYVTMSGNGMSAMKDGADAILTRKKLIEGKCLWCADQQQQQQMCCYDAYSNGVAIPFDSTADFTKVEGLTLKVTIAYERLLDQSMVSYVRDLPTLSAREREAFCDQLRAKNIFKAKQLQSTSIRSMLKNAGIEGDVARASRQSLKAKAAMPVEERQQREREAQIRRDDANSMRNEAKAEATALADNAKAEVKAALNEVKEQAKSDLATVSAKLAEVDLGKADLDAGNSELKSLVDSMTSQSEDVAKGVKLTTYQLIQQQGIFAGRVFHDDWMTDTEIKEDVVEFTPDTLATLPSNTIGTRWTDANVAGGTGDLYSGPATVIAEGYSKDLLEPLVMRKSPLSSTEYSFQTSKASDKRRATRLFDTYGSSTSSYVETQHNGGLSIGVPGVFKLGASYADKSSHTRASSDQGESDRQQMYTQTGHEFYQVSYYSEPRAIINVPLSMLQPATRFTADVTKLFSEYADAAVPLIFKQYGTHICPHVTLGGYWRITAEARSMESTQYSNLATAASKAVSYTQSTGRSYGADAAGSGESVSGSAAYGGGNANGNAEASNSASGVGTQASQQNKNIEVTVQQEWKGGSSGGTPAAWRLSLSPDQNSNWNILERRFENCKPVWAFFPEDLADNAVKVCVAWYQEEILSLDDDLIDKEGKDELLGQVVQKCSKEGDLVELGILQESYDEAVARSTAECCTFLNQTECPDRCSWESGFCVGKPCSSQATGISCKEGSSIAHGSYCTVKCSSTTSGRQYAEPAFLQCLNGVFSPYSSTCNSCSQWMSSLEPSSSSQPESGCRDEVISVARCEEFCSSLPSCRGYWYSSGGLCCPRATFSSTFNQKLGDGGFYSYHKECGNLPAGKGNGSYYTYSPWPNKPVGVAGSKASGTYGWVDPETCAEAIFHTTAFAPGGFNMQYIQNVNGKCYYYQSTGSSGNCGDQCWKLDFLKQCSAMVKGDCDLTRCQQNENGDCEQMVVTPTSPAPQCSSACPTVPRPMCSGSIEATVRSTDPSLCVPSYGGLVSYLGEVCEGGKILWTSARAIDKRPGLTNSQCSWDWTHHADKATYMGSCGVPPTVCGAEQLPTSCQDSPPQST